MPSNPPVGGANAGICGLWSTLHEVQGWSEVRCGRLRPGKGGDLNGCVIKMYQQSMMLVDAVLVMMDGWFLFMAVDLDQWFFVMDYPLMNGQSKASSLETCMDLKMHTSSCVSFRYKFYFFRGAVLKKKRPWWAVANWLIWKQRFLTVDSTP